MLKFFKEGVRNLGLELGFLAIVAILVLLSTTWVFLVWPLIILLIAWIFLLGVGFGDSDQNDPLSWLDYLDSVIVLLCVVILIVLFATR